MHVSSGLSNGGLQQGGLPRLPPPTIESFRGCRGGMLSPSSSIFMGKPGKAAPEGPPVEEEGDRRRGEGKENGKLCAFDIGEAELEIFHLEVPPPD